MAGDKWDGKISNLNISDRHFLELHAELSKMHHKARSDSATLSPSWAFILFKFLAE